MLTVPRRVPLASELPRGARLCRRFAPRCSCSSRTSMSSAVSLSPATSGSQNLQVVRPCGLQPRRVRALPQLLWDSWHRAGQDSTTRGPRASASTFYSSAQGLPISFSACKQLFPPQPALNRSGPCRLNVTSRSSNRSSGGSGSRASGSHLPAYVVGAQQIFGYVPATSPHFDDEYDGPTKGRLNATCKKERISYAPPPYQPTQMRDWTALWSSRLSCWPVRLCHRPPPTPTLLQWG